MLQTTWNVSAALHIKVENAEKTRSSLMFKLNTFNLIYTPLSNADHFSTPQNISVA